MGKAAFAMGVVVASVHVRTIAEGGGVNFCQFGVYILTE